MSKPARPFPHSVEFERSLLGGLIRNQSRFSDVAAVLAPSHFYRPDHAALYELMLTRWLNGKEVDAVTVTAAVVESERPDRFGGIPYVVELPDQVPSTANLMHYAVEIRDRSTRRLLIAEMQGATDALFDTSLDAPATVGAFMIEASRLTRGHDRGGGTYEQAIDEADAFVEATWARGDGLAGLSTGLYALDQITLGLQPAKLYIIGARPGLGKTALAIGFAEAVAAQEKWTAFFSLEMPRREMALRSVSRLSKIPFERIIRGPRPGGLEPHEFERYHEAMRRVKEYPIAIYDRSMSVQDVVTATKAELQLRGPALGMVVVDYLQKMRMSGRTGANRENEISEMSGALKNLALDTGLPIVVAAQLSRKLEERKDKRPIPSDLRESGSIEQDADVILFPFREGYYDKYHPHQEVAEVDVAKQRGGRTGKIDCMWDGPTTSFYDDPVDKL
jgi:replicative DNA helicase